jgi:prepilin-type processing-associated H-X9-DG protein
MKHAEKLDSIERDQEIVYIKGSVQAISQFCIDRHGGGVMICAGWRTRMSRLTYSEQSPFQIVIVGKQPWGAIAYGLHGRRFNYLLHDGHAAIHRITDTVGAGTTNSPKGMWTRVRGD